MNYKKSVSISECNGEYQTNEIDNFRIFYLTVLYFTAHSFFMRTLIIVWLGQLVCTFGTRMSSFAIRIWAWEITGQATAIALVGVSTQIPRLLITTFAGIIVDCCNRKLLLIAGDTITVLSTLAILLLYITGKLQIGHLYLTGAVNGAFNQLRSLAYSASISLMVPKQQ